MVLRGLHGIGVGWPGTDDIIVPCWRIQANIFSFFFPFLLLSFSNPQACQSIICRW